MVKRSSLFCPVRKSLCELKGTDMLEYINRRDITIALLGVLVGILMAAAA